MGVCQLSDRLTHLEELFLFSDTSHVEFVYAPRVTPVKLPIHAYCHGTDMTFLNRGLRIKL